MSKQLVDQAWGAAVRNGMRQELLAQTALFAGEEHRVAKAAELERARARRSET
jgi:hypothetical protein